MNKLKDLYMFRAHRPILRRVHTAVHTTIGSVTVLFWPCALYIQSTRPEQYRHLTNGCVNSCVNSPEDGPVGPKHLEIWQYINKIEIVTSVGFYSIRYRKLKEKELDLCFWRTRCARYYGPVVRKAKISF